MIKINEAILNHFYYGDGASAYLRGLIPDITDKIENLFSARSDIQRIKFAEELAEGILSLTEFHDMVALRDEVATLEIKRMVNYKKQTDHTAHTVYLFLLGIWIYDNIDLIRNQIDNKIKSSKAVKMFIFQWIFASLLHDIGYLFYNCQSDENRFSRAKFDDMFKYDYIPNFVKHRVKNSFRDLIKINKEFVKKYTSSLGHLEETEPAKLLEKLNNIPWVKDLVDSSENGLEVLLSEHDTDKTLIKYAKEIAKKGYNGDGINPEIDHAIASGLMLLKYTSVWYWLYDKAKVINPSLFEELNEGFKYPKELFIEQVIPACQAVIYHNIKNVKFNVENDPLLYLAILCDELQIWDRFWSGEELIDSWKEVEHCMGEQISADLINNEFSRKKLHLILSEEICNKLKKTLSERLVGWNEIVKITSRG